MPKSFWREAIRVNFCSRFTRTSMQSNRDVLTLRHAITTNLVTSIGADAFTPTALQHATARVPMDWMEMATGFATMWTIASELKTNVVCAMAPGRSTNVDAMIWARMNAIALARSSMHWVYVVVIVWQTSTVMGNAIVSCMSRMSQSWCLMNRGRACHSA